MKNVQRLVSQLRAHLRERLPEYMVPSAFVVMDRLPLTSQGKVDRQALGEPERSISGLNLVCIPPRTEAEAAVASVWRMVLGIERPGVHDNFFDAGGNSLQAVRLIDELNRAFGTRLSTVSVFERPTISALARIRRRRPPSARTVTRIGRSPR